MKGERVYFEVYDSEPDGVLESHVITMNDHPTTLDNMFNLLENNLKHYGVDLSEFGVGVFSADMTCHFIEYDYEQDIDLAIHSWRREPEGILRGKI